MRNLLAFVVAVPVCLLVACSSSSDGGTASPVDASTDAPPSNPSDAGADAPADSAPTNDAGDGGMYVEPTCTLRDDSGGPGQYSDTCVQRSWIKDYAGTYTSATCELTVSITGAVAATFTMKVLSGALAGTYVIDWEGGAGGAGNDSYYRFTTDATFATTKTLNFNAGQAVNGGPDERNASLRVEGLDTGAGTFTGRFGQLVAGKDADVDCGAFTKK